MNKESNEKIVPDISNIEQCYGKLKSCPVRNKCTHGSVCISRATEQDEDFYYHRFRNVSIGNMFFDPEEENNVDHRQMIFQNDEDEQFYKDCQAVAGLVSESSESPSYASEFTIEDVDKKALMLIERLAQMKRDQPTVFDALFSKLISGMSNEPWTQSKFAQEKGITRAGINKRLLSELCIAQKRNSKHEQMERELNNKILDYETKIEEFKEDQKLYSSLSDRDRLIFHKIYIENKTYDTVANELRISKMTVRRVNTFIRSKMKNKEHFFRSKKRKNEKKSNFFRSHLPMAWSIL